MYTHFTFTLMAHCTSGAIRGSVSCSRTLRQEINLLITKRLLYLRYHCRPGNQHWADSPLYRLCFCFCCCMSLYAVLNPFKDLKTETLHLPEFFPPSALTICYGKQRPSPPSSSSLRTLCIILTEPFCPN